MSSLKDWLTAEHSKKQTAFIVDQIHANPILLQELTGYLLGKDPLLKQRASWPLGYLDKRLLAPYYSSLVQHLYADELHDAVYRNTLKIFEGMKVIPEEVEEALTDICFTLLDTSHTPIAVKVFSMTILEKITKKYPELSGELEMLIRNQLPYSSAGFQSRGKKILSNLSKRF